MSSTTNLQNGDNWTHLNNLETLGNIQVDGNLTVLGTINGSEDNAFVMTAITTVGNGTLTAVGLTSGIINRTGPVAAYSDATDTAAAIYSALGSPAANTTVRSLIKNGTAFTQTITAGTGVTLPTTVIVPAFSIAEYLITVNSATAVTLAHISTTPITTGTALTVPAIGSLSTVGAGTITAALTTGGFVSRSGSQSATPFTDTTDTAAAIIAANANLIGKIGTAMPFLYVNTTNATATLAGGTGVTVSGITTVPAGMAARYIITYTAAATLTMVGISVEQAATSQQEVVLAGSTSGTTTIVATAAAGSSTLTTPAVTGTFASTTGSNLYLNDLKRSSATITSSSTTLANVTGLSFTVVPGTYKFRIVAQGVADGTGGIKYALNYTTTALTSLQATSVGTTAAAAATQSTTSTTTQALLFDQAAAVLQVVTEGTMVVSTGGTIDVQVAQHAANASSTTVLGSTAEFVRIA